MPPIQPKNLPVHTRTPSPSMHHMPGISSITLLQTYVKFIHASYSRHVRVDTGHRQATVTDISILGHKNILAPRRIKKPTPLPLPAPPLFPPFPFPINHEDKLLKNPPAGPRPPRISTSALSHRAATPANTRPRTLGLITQILYT